jgi:hypothetical protein
MQAAFNKPTEILTAANITPALISPSSMRLTMRGIKRKRTTANATLCATKATTAQIPKSTNDTELLITPLNAKEKPTMPPPKPMAAAAFLMALFSQRRP